ncbi:PREDICTED: UV-stimulated scaffold protein A homolog [Fragaria vesca subsp. vesca]|uniref:UV-stimulated scaffold protein A homolog n=1 Tax=Fragaria vesca subsp. vesca TaxID=101020 RepID=UPI0002C36716|nr:PREDICTED: UV-stimulated scaffold protein A homolog [Fragaria vesca subsp. vesca]
MEEEDGGKVRVLIEKATESIEPEVNPRLLKAIKAVVRRSDSELRLAAHLLMDLMKRDHSQVRYLTLLIIDELFMRSKLFRCIVVENMDQLLTLSVGFRRNLPLPAPANVAATLRLKAIEFLEKWNASYGVHYRQIRLGFDYLKNTLKFQFPNLQANAARVQQERRERERKSKEILVKKFQSLEGSFGSIKEEIQSTVDEIGECLEIACAKEEHSKFIPLDDEEDFEEIHSYELRQLRLQTLEEEDKVHENTENKVVFDALRELYKLLLTKHLVAVQEWITVLVRVELNDNRSRDSYLKEFIDIRNQIQSVKKKCEESGCTLLNTVNPDGEDIWEEGNVGSVETGSSSRPSNNIEDLAGTSTSTSNEVKERSSKADGNVTNAKKIRSREGGVAKLDPLKSKLLAEAPEVNWGSYLDNWGSKRDVLANQRGLELESHWGRVDQDAVIPAEKIAELNLQATVYKEKQVDIPPCRAPLRNGKLCQRKDLRVCPFHGSIIPRDDEGKPLNQNPSKDETTQDTGANLVEQLAKQAVKNVREKDKDLARKREIDKLALKRAKLAKVREHNDMVLRDAAMASTSRSAAIGEDLEAANSTNPSSRNKKKTLAAMLKKKETPKDRLAQRLLNTRASAATVRQLTLGADTNYREAFPNQW